MYSKICQSFFSHLPLFYPFILFEEMNLSGWDTVVTDLASDLSVAENENCMEVFDKIVESIKSLNCEVGCTFE